MSGPGNPEVRLRVAVQGPRHTHAAGKTGILVSTPEPGSVYVELRISGDHEAVRTASANVELTGFRVVTCVGCRRWLRFCNPKSDDNDDPLPIVFREALGTIVRTPRPAFVCGLSCWSDIQEQIRDRGWVVQPAP